MSQMFFSSITMAGTPVNEDTAFADKVTGWVIDAATGLTDSKYTSGESDGAWFKECWDKYLKSSIDNWDYTMKEVIRNGIISISNEFYKEAGTDQVKVVEKPSASLAMVKFSEENMEYLLLGDCSILVQYTDGHVERIKDTSIERLDHKAVMELDRVRNENKLSFEEARKAINPLLIKHRCMKNTPEGYWTLEFDESAVDHCLNSSIPVKDISAVLLLSDGFASIYDTYKFCSIEELLHLLENKDLSEVSKIIRSIEDEDSDMVRFPRFKKCDDASAVYYRLSK